MMKIKSVLILLSILSSSLLFAQLTEHKSNIVNNTEIQYFLYTPIQKQELYPLVVFLHGGAQSDTDLNIAKAHGIPKRIAEGKDFPFYVFAPLNPNKNGLWDDRAIHKKVTKLVDSLPIDKKRIYLAGLSRGGDGIWRMAVNNPNTYAAMISVCAADIPMVYIKWAKNLPVWFFHGEKDAVVSVEQTKEAYKTLKKLNPKTKLTIYPDAAHDSWTETYNNEAVYSWLLEQHL
ncbi:prolyl oligopeptidase family serine peptidase [Tamlana sp. 2_MG-2023]|uniref:carboxylesterase family protein n=1 Tax=unclassified Tamlana TaxID=2614803 RepID=UPI0026E1DA35|nr:MULTISPECIES: prolyl oligopeptidase family serine peptidase [unclassified Tamlana]MDO6760105.1 prolyl oligopeptidase family serine peptidase [Tamlana sp. 2_MG-2023]MDO6790197.1 prolyl oligopeptidase family serine peptidase [Tamlana sp. 1_MG-2023]